VNLRPEDSNLAPLVAAATKLEPLLDQIAFVGGCVTGLLLTDRAAAPMRRTLDVVAIVAIASYAEFTMLEKRLRELGFRESRAEGAPICRRLHGDLILDLMPTDPSILGFTNRWYGPALENAQRRTRIGGRGKNDFRACHDLEDIVTGIDGRPEIVGEAPPAAADLQNYLRDEFRTLLSNRDFLDALPGHLLPDAASQQRIGLVMKCMQQLAEG
jgi:hypothetical protein